MNRFPAGTAAPSRSEILFSSVNPPKNTRGYQEMGGLWFRVRESSTPEPGTEFKFELPAKFGVGRSKLGVPVHNYTFRGKRPMAKLDFF